MYIAVYRAMKTAQMDQFCAFCYSGEDLVMFTAKSVQSFVFEFEYLFAFPLITNAIIGKRICSTCVNLIHLLHKFTANAQIVENAFCTCFTMLQIERDHFGGCVDPNDQVDSNTAEASQNYLEHDSAFDPQQFTSGSSAVEHAIGGTGMWSAVKRELHNTGEITTHCLIEEISVASRVSFPIPLFDMTSDLSTNLNSNDVVCYKNLAVVESQQCDDFESGAEEYSDEEKDQEVDDDVMVFFVKDTDSNLYICNVCKKSYKYSSYLRLHALLHTGSKPFLCTTCNRSFSHKSNLTKHIRTHTGEKPYSCTLCDRSFSDIGSLYQHRNVHTESRPFPCTMCELTFKSKVRLNRHLRVHSGIKRHKCDICNTSFTTRFYLRQHGLIHLGIKPYTCDKCDRTFRTKTDLNRHAFFHTGEKRHACSTCGRSFTHKRDLQIHNLVHTGERPHACPFCDQRFGQRANYRRHLKVHSGVKPYSCDVCNHSFAEKRTLIDHARIHSGERPFVCTTCHRSFRLKSGYDRHRKHVCRSESS